MGKGLVWEVWKQYGLSIADVSNTKGLVEFRPSFFRWEACRFDNIFQSRRAAAIVAEVLRHIDRSTHRRGNVDTIKAAIVPAVVDEAEML